jgi:hypothetical protein
MKTNGPANDDAEQELPGEDDEIVNRALSRMRKTDAAGESPTERRWARDQEASDE